MRRRYRDCAYVFAGYVQRSNVTHNTLMQVKL